MPTFNYRSYAYVGSVSVDLNIDYDEALNEIGVEFVKDWLLEVAGENLDAPNATDAALEDPVRRLEVITWLRSNGWKVEPA